MTDPRGLERVDEFLEQVFSAFHLQSSRTRALAPDLYLLLTLKALGFAPADGDKERSCELAGPATEPSDNRNSVRREAWRRA